MADEIRKINGYTLKDEVARTTLETKADREHDHPKFVTHDEFDNLITNLVTREEIEDKADTDHQHDDLYLKKEEISDLVTKEELEEKIVNTEVIIDQKIAELIDLAPEALNTLNELAEAIENNKNIYDAYISSISNTLNNKANLDHIHSDYALIGHEHEQYLTEHQDISFLASKDELEKIKELIKYDKIEIGKCSFINNIPYFFDGEYWRNYNGDIYTTNDDVIKEKFILEYKVSPYNDELLLTESGTINYRYIPHIYMTKDIEYELKTDSITLILSDGTKSNNLDTNISLIDRIQILYDVDTYSIKFKGPHDDFGHAVKEIIEINTNNFISMSYMFYNCKQLMHINLDNFTTNNVTDMSYMFYNCSSLTTIDTSLWSSKVHSIRNMFYNCSSLTSLNLNNLTTKSVSDMSYIFYNCSSLTTIELSSWDSRNVDDMDYIFYNCSSLKSLDLSTWFTDDINRAVCSFSGCSSLEFLDISNFKTTYIKGAYSKNMFQSLNPNINWNYNGTNYSKFNLTERGTGFSGIFPW